MSIRVYISGALIGSNNLALARSRYEECANVLRKAGFSPYLPHRSSDPQLMAGFSPEDVFSMDVQALMSSEAIVAFLDEPSHGVGAEIAISVARRIPIVAMMRKTARVSRFIVGMIERSSAAKVIAYENEKELSEALPGTVLQVLRLKDNKNEDGLIQLLRKI
jgi:nucleoside 2-deoxyribosyltransferase